MDILCTDMDNTIIYSYKHNIDDNKINVEIYNGKEISFISEKTYSLLQQIKREVVIVPTSTRTEEQYKRIDLKIGNIKYALVCNGGVLLVDGKRDNEWYEESKCLIKDSRPEIEKAIGILQNEIRRKFEIRFIDELFVFTKCEAAEDVVNALKKMLDTAYVDVFNNGEKVYVVPVNLRKGIAIRRFKKKIHPQHIIAAGDSEFDVSMVEEADFGLVPNGFKKLYSANEKVIEMEDGKLFSESLLEKCIMIKAEL